MPSRGPKRAVVVDVVILAALAVTLELGLRALAPEYGHKIFDNKFTGSYPIAVTAAGYRGPGQPIEKPPGQFRVLALGDSETFGTGVPAEQTWPAQLSHRLAARYPNNGVINGGFEGVGMRDLSGLWQVKWRAYAPDVVVVGITPNMVSLVVARPTPLTFEQITRSHGDPPSKLSRLTLALGRQYHSIYTVGFVSTVAQRALYWGGLLDHRLNPKYPYGDVLAYGWGQGDIAPDLARRAWTGLGEDYRKLAAEVRSSGAKLVLVWLAPRFDVSDSCRDNQKNMQKERFSIDPVAEVAKMVQGSDTKFVSTLPYLRAARAKWAAAGQFHPLYIHFDTAHYDEEGNSIVAQAVADSL